MKLRVKRRDGLIGGMMEGLFVLHSCAHDRDSFK